jgi:hypothetical protein
VTFISIIRFSSLGRSHAISGSSMLVGLDMQYPGISPSPFIASETNASETNASENEDTTGASDEPQSEWNQRLLREEKKLRAWEIRRLTTLAGSMLVPTLAAALLLSKAPINISSAMTDAKNLLTALTGGMTFEILDGVFIRSGILWQSIEPLVSECSVRVHPSGRRSRGLRGGCRLRSGWRCGVGAVGSCVEQTLLGGGIDGVFHKWYQSKLHAYGCGW